MAHAGTTVPILARARRSRIVSACAEALALGFASELLLFWISLGLSTFCHGRWMMDEPLGQLAVYIQLPGALFAELMELGNGIPYRLLTFILQTVFWSILWLVLLQWRAALTWWRLWRMSRRRGFPLDDVN